MSNPHKHAAVIKAWADGADIEFRNPCCSGEVNNGWIPLSSGVICANWYNEYEYRVKPMPHKWQKEIDAFNRGEEVQWQYNYSPNPLRPCWQRCVDPDWNHSKVTYRIKPKPEIQRWSVASNGIPYVSSKGTLMLTFEDGELMKAEVLK